MLLSGTCRISASGGSGDAAKVTRIDAQSPTVQATVQSQSQQQQSTTAAASMPNAAAFMGMHPGSYPGYYYPNGIVPNPYMFSVSTLSTILCRFVCEICLMLTKAVLYIAPRYNSELTESGHFLEFHNSFGVVLTCGIIIFINMLDALSNYLFIGRATHAIRYSKHDDAWLYNDLRLSGAQR